MREGPFLNEFVYNPLLHQKTSIPGRFEIRGVISPADFKRCLATFDHERGIFYELLDGHQKNVADGEDHDLSRYLITPFCFQPGFDQLNELSSWREMLASAPYGYRLEDRANGSQAIISFQWLPSEESVEEYYNAYPYYNLSRSSGIEAGDIFIDQIQGYMERRKGVSQPFFKQLLWPELLATYVAHFAYFGGLRKIFYLPRELVRPTRFKMSPGSDWIYRQVPTRLGFTLPPKNDSGVFPYSYEFPQE